MIITSKMMELFSWGNYPKIRSKVFDFDHSDQLKEIIQKHSELIPYGNGRSYGDSALSPKVIRNNSRRFFLGFDPTKGVLHVQAGLWLSEIIDVFVPRGWFLKITPGTKMITVGGAIASDVHGKNHHKVGCFSECVKMFRLMLPDGRTVKCSRRENVALFRATCGGMGLTGIILDAYIELIRIKSKYIEQRTIKTVNLKETFEAFENYRETPYSVAWIDCLARGSGLGRSLLMVGDFSHDENLDYSSKNTLEIPFYFPSFTLNAWSVKIFNWIYYQKSGPFISKQKVDLDTFFYPLDSIGSWNKIYGRNGLVQYQFILPRETSYVGLKEFLEKVAHFGQASFLAVLKLYGPANDNYLSFPMEGYSLSLDFKVQKGLFEFLDQLDQIVLKYRGRIYLAKDVRVSKSVFESGYPKIDQFRALRKKYQMRKKFSSLQSQRVGL